MNLCYFCSKLKKVLQTPISILSLASISALGASASMVWKSYVASVPLFSKKKMGNSLQWVSQLSSETEQELSQLQKDNPAYKKLDRTVLLSIVASRKATKQFVSGSVGVNIGSSRGATQLFETYHKQFLAKEKVSPFSSPTTTLGNISSWVGQDIGAKGMTMEHSVTCSTSLHALLNGIAWLQANMADQFVVGGSEAALTPFTLTQIQALKLYSKSEDQAACHSMDFEKSKNTMVLGEGAAVALIEKGIADNALALISGFGFASEKIEHGSAISENADCFQRSMKEALASAKLKTVDAIIMHAPGTVKGDLAEKKAIDLVFTESEPLLTSNKWMLGHTFGASGMLSIEMAVLMLQHQRFIENPFYIYSEEDRQRPLNSIMVNAVGFGGNAVSIIITKP